MVKVTLEKEDIEKLIKAKYPKAEIVSGLDEKAEIVIKMDELPSLTPVKPVPPPTPVKPQVILSDGSVDAKASGLTTETRERTVPGGQMGRERGRLRTF